MATIKLHEPGLAHARALIRAGKINDGAWDFSKADRDKLLGPKGNHVEEFARHHLGMMEDDEPDADGDEGRTAPSSGLRPPSPARGEGRDLDAGTGAGGTEATIGTAERYKHPFGKEGEIYSGALKGIKRSKGVSDEILQHADELLDLIREEQRGSIANPPPNPQPGRSLNPKREVRCLMAGVELRANEVAGSPGTVHGYAAVFDKFSEDLGYFREKIAPGAFADCLSQDVRALVNHNPNKLIGRNKSGTLRMVEDGLGLRVEIDLPDTQTGRDTATEISRGDMDGMSFTFDTEADSWDRATTPPTRTLIKCSRVYDVGPVTYPAYTDTSAAMRSLDRSNPDPDPAPKSGQESSLSLTLAQARLRLAEVSTPV
jgi:Escherichia/Staphylococcus phage prohead protease